MPPKAKSTHRAFADNENEALVSKTEATIKADDPNETLIGACKKAGINKILYTPWRQQFYLCQEYYKKVSHLFPMCQLHNRICADCTVK